MGFQDQLSLMQVKSVADCSKWHSAILSTFIKLPFVIKIFVLSIFEWPLKTGFTVQAELCHFYLGMHQASRLGYKA